jgi:hypothetical protein
MEICKLGTIQTGIFGGKVIEKKKSVTKEEINDNMTQLTIDKAWG